MYHRQPNPDLPAIPEEASTPTSSSVNTSIDIENLDVEVDDTSSYAESYANSYAFTLDNVGLDEENSLVGSVVGSVIGTTRSRDSLIHTPPSQCSPDRISKHERRLHRETCRTLGLPYSYETDSSPSSGSETLSKEDGGLSVGSSSGSATAAVTDELLLEKRKSKIDKMWPWPTSKAGDKEKSATSNKPLDQTMNSTNTDARLVTMAKISETTSIYTNRMKEAFASFNERIEDAYQKANPQQNPTINGEDNKENNNTLGQSVDKKPKTVQDLFHPGWVDSYKEANPMTKLTFGTTILLMLLCIIGLLATVGVSQSGSQPNLGVDGHPDVTTHHDLDLVVSETATNDVVDPMTTVVPPVPEVPSAPAEEEEEVVVVVAAVNTTMPTTSMPSRTPTASPSHTPTASPIILMPDANDNSVVSKEDPCLNKEGKFLSAQGKHRKCHWITNQDPGALYSDRLDAECGGGGAAGESHQATELGLNCPFTCRAYNGCLTLEEAPGKDSAEYRGREGGGQAAAGLGGEEDSVAEKVQSAPESTSSPTDPLTNAPTSNAPTTNAPTKKPTSGPIIAVESSTEEEEVIINDLPTFTDIRGRERQCWWLDIRNRNQRTIRRDVNCVNVAVQVTCPTSCADYVTMAVMNSQVLMSQEGSLAPAVDVDGEEDDTPKVITAPQLLRMNNEYIPSVIVPNQSSYEHPQDMCYDRDGFFLNNHGEPRECSWLINSRDPIDETRRIENCGYPGSDYPVGTDLGRMCKNTCGTCGL